MMKISKIFLLGILACHGLFAADWKNPGEELSILKRPFKIGCEEYLDTRKLVHPEKWHIVMNAFQKDNPRKISFKIRFWIGANNDETREKFLNERQPLLMGYNNGWHNDQILQNITWDMQGSSPLFTESTEEESLAKNTLMVSGTFTPQYAQDILLLLESPKLYDIAIEDASRLAPGDVFQYTPDDVLKGQEYSDEDLFLALTEKFFPWITQSQGPVPVPYVPYSSPRRYDSFFHPNLSEPHNYRRLVGSAFFDLREGIANNKTMIIEFKMYRGQLDALKPWLEKNDIQFVPGRRYDGGQDQPFDFVSVDFMGPCRSLLKLLLTVEDPQAPNSIGYPFQEGLGNGPLLLQVTEKYPEIKISLEDMDFYYGFNWESLKKIIDRKIEGLQEFEIQLHTLNNFEKIKAIFGDRILETEEETKPEKNYTVVGEPLIPRKNYTAVVRVTLPEIFYLMKFLNHKSDTVTVKFRDFYQNVGTALDRFFNKRRIKINWR